jgi:hypothetical protein
MILTPSVQADRALDDFHARPVTGPDVQTDWPGMILTPDVQPDWAGIEVSKFYRGPEIKSIGV